MMWMLILSAAFGLAALAAAKPVARWIASRDEDWQPPPTSPDEPPKVWTLQEQVDNKVYWDTPEFEIRTWLEERVKLPEALATALIENARKRRATRIRHQALYGVLASIVGMALTALPVVREVTSGHLELPKVIPYIFGFSFCAVVLCRYGTRLVTGKLETPVDS